MAIVKQNATVGPEYITMLIQAIFSEYSIENISPTQFKVNVTGINQDFDFLVYGTDFVTTRGGITGKINAFEFKFPEGTVFSYKNLDVEAEPFIYLAERASNLLIEGLLSRDDTITGSTGDDVLRGYRGDDRLDGGGGNDTLKGDEGDDLYIVDAGDTAVERAGEGFDAIRASVDVKLGNGTEIEQIRLTGSGDLDAAGNVFGNRIIGNSGDNVISGGLGRDILQGLGGADRFAFKHGLQPSNVDRILDFSDEDRIALDDRIFNTLDRGRLDADVFKDIGGPGRVDANDRVIYDSDTGVLFYDANGSGAGGRSVIVRLKNEFDLAFGDISVV